MHIPLFPRLRPSLLVLTFLVLTAVFPASPPSPPPAAHHTVHSVPTTLNAAALSLLRRGRLREAEALLSRAAALSTELEPPGDAANIRFRLAVVRQELGMVGGAVEAYALALAQQPDLYEARFNLGRLWAVRADTDLFRSGAGVRDAALRQAVHHLALASINASTARVGAAVRVEPGDGGENEYPRPVAFGCLEEALHQLGRKAEATAAHREHVARHTAWASVRRRRRRRRPRLWRAGRGNRHDASGRESGRHDGNKQRFQSDPEGDSCRRLQRWLIELRDNQRRLRLKRERAAGKTSTFSSSTSSPPTPLPSPRLPQDLPKGLCTPLEPVTERALRRRRRSVPTAGTSTPALPSSPAASLLRRARESLAERGHATLPPGAVLTEEVSSFLSHHLNSLLSSGAMFQGDVADVDQADQGAHDGKARWSLINDPLTRYIGDRVQVRIV